MIQQLHTPRSVPEALRLKSKLKGRAVFLAGRGCREDDRSVLGVGVVGSSPITLQTDSRRNGQTAGHPIHAFGDADHPAPLLSGGIQSPLDRGCFVDAPVGLGTVSHYAHVRRRRNL